MLNLTPQKRIQDFVGGWGGTRNMKSMQPPLMARGGNFTLQSIK